MDHRAIIPLSLLGFCLFVAALWSYLSATQEPPPADWLRRAPIAVPRDDEGEQNTSSKSTATPGTTPGRPTVKHMSSRIVRREIRSISVSDVAQQLDELLVRVRLDLADSAYFQIPLGWRDLHTERAEQALERFDRLLRLGRDNGAACAGKAMALASLGRQDDAEAAFRRALDLLPRDAGVRYNYGVLLCRRSKFGEAAVQFREAVARDPHHAAAWYNLASLAQRDGRLTEARDGWQQVTALSPDDATAWYHLGVMWMDFDEPILAQRCFAIYTTLRPSDADGYISLASVSRELGLESDEAEALEIAHRFAECDEEPFDHDDLLATGSHSEQ